MTTTVLKRQFIIDAAGSPIGVILPLEEFAVVEEILEQHFPAANEMRKLELMERAANDPLYG
jgi:hypothetical protein